MKLSIGVMALMTMLAGCATGSDQPTGLPAQAKPCPASRPQVCTMDYRPAFGYDDRGGIVAEFANACRACADQRVAFTLPSGPTQTTFPAPPAAASPPR